MKMRHIALVSLSSLHVKIKCNYVIENIIRYHYINAHFHKSNCLINFYAVWQLFTNSEVFLFSSASMKFKNSKKSADDSGKPDRKSFCRQNGTGRTRSSSLLHQHSQQLPQDQHRNLIAMPLPLAAKKVMSSFYEGHSEDEEDPAQQGQGGNHPGAHSEGGAGAAEQIEPGSSQDPGANQPGQQGREIDETAGEGQSGNAADPEAIREESEGAEEGMEEEQEEGDVVSVLDSEEGEGEEEGTGTAQASSSVRTLMGPPSMPCTIPMSRASLVAQPPAGSQLPSLHEEVRRGINEDSQGMTIISCKICMGVFTTMEAARLHVFHHHPGLALEDCIDATEKEVALPSPRVSGPTTSESTDPPAGTSRGSRHVSSRARKGKSSKE